MTITTFLIAVLFAVGVQPFCRTSSILGTIAGVREKLGVCSMKLLSYFFVVIRLCLLLRFLRWGLIPSLFALSEMGALATTIWSLKNGRVDSGRWAWFVPVAYLMPALLGLHRVVYPLAVVAAMGFVLCQWAVRVYMGTCLTVGVPCFSRLLDSGPYAFCRHPLAALEIQAVLALAVGFFSPRNMLVALAVAVSISTAVRIEEKFLKQIAEYGEYCRRVRSRFFPMPARL